MLTLLRKIGLLTSQRKGPEKRVRIAYRTALLALVFLTGTSYVILTIALDRSQSESLMYQDISNQRTLSQRIVLLGEHALQTNDEGQRREILAYMQGAMAELTSSHAALSRIISNQGETDPASRALHTLFFGSPVQLNYRVRSLLTNARQLIKHAPDSPEIAAIYLGPMEEIVIGRILPAMDRVIDIYSRESVNSNAVIEFVHMAILLLSLGVLGAIWMFLFRPLATRIGARTEELVVARDNMRHAALHDGLTGLANRQYAMDALNVVTKANSDRKTAILLLDLDNFKSINDSYGHICGDNLLKSVAARLRLVVGTRGTACRMGGDEFLVLIPNVKEPAEVFAVAEGIIDTLNKPAHIAGRHTKVQTSIGIACHPADGTSCEDILIAADLALYAAKDAGKGVYCMFSRNMENQLHERKQLEQEIDTAISQAEFKPVFQPQVCISTGSITAVEALVRWHHPDRGVLLPADFLDTATDLGKMPQITHLLVEQALSAACQWKKAGVSFGRLAINISAQVLLHPEFVMELTEAADRHAMPFDQISVEIVESVAIDENDTHTMAILEQLRGLGIRVEIDDFGTGFASLIHLNRDLFDRVKIDRQFINDIDKCERSRIIVESIIRLSKALGLDVVAEGMERQEEMDTLLELGCREFQGNAITPPLPANVFADWYRTQTPVRLQYTDKTLAPG